MRDAASSPPLRVLVVDDCRDMASSTCLLLKMWGHETCEVHDGKEALALAAVFRPDVILLDIGLPDMNGYEVARRLRAEPGRQYVYLASLTGYGRPEDCLRSLESGCDQHLIKPVATEVLERMLASRKRARDEAAHPPVVEIAASAVDQPEPTTLDSRIAQRAETCLRSNSYLALRNVSCECLEGVLTLRGCLPTYHLSQVAERAVAGVEGVFRIDNHIEVISGPRGRSMNPPTEPASAKVRGEAKSTKREAERN